MTDLVLDSSFTFSIDRESSIFLHFLMLNYFYHRPLPSLLLTQLPLPFPASDHLICSTAPPTPPLIPLNAHVCITYHKDILHLIDRPRK